MESPEPKRLSLGLLAEFSAFDRRLSLPGARVELRYEPFAFSFVTVDLGYKFSGLDALSLHHLPFGLSFGASFGENPIFDFGVRSVLDLKWIEAGIDSDPVFGIDVGPIFALRLPIFSDAYAVFSADFAFRLRRQAYRLTDQIGTEFSETESPFAAALAAGMEWAWY